jgi:SAM-dependent methyltransferase
MPSDNTSGHSGHGLTAWLHALEERHFADLRFSEVTRALRALSMAYVERRLEGKPRSAMDTAGKRAAFALFYAPLHFVATKHVVHALQADSPPPRHILDVGCGTGVAGAAWALACSPPAAVTGIDRHPWAVEESRWTYAQLGVQGRAQRGEIPEKMRVGREHAVIAAYVLNELSEPVRRAFADRLADAAGQGVRVLILEPISRQAVPWWDESVRRLEMKGFRADQWRFDIERPAIVAKLDEASGLNHRTITMRTLYHG